MEKQTNIGGAHLGLPPRVIYLLTDSQSQACSMSGPINLSFLATVGQLSTGRWKLSESASNALSSG